MPEKLARKIETEISAYRSERISSLEAARLAGLNPSEGSLLVLSHKCLRYISLQGITDTGRRVGRRYFRFPTTKQT